MTSPSRRRRFAERRKACGFNQEEFAEAVGVDRSTVQRWEKGEYGPQPWQRPKIAMALDVSANELEALLTPDIHHVPQPPVGWTSASPPTSDDEFEALELARRVTASDVGVETLSRLENAFDELAMKYPVSPPQELLERVRRHAAYVSHLMGARMTLAEQRRLFVIGGWFQLFGATLHIDLNQEHAATARLQTAATLARHAEHREIEAWCFETDAWRVLTGGEYNRALELSQVAQQLAPAGSSVAIQATAQEGRARARLGEKETYAAIDRVQRMSAVLIPRKGTEHHYQYDPAKSLAYTATTLAWVGDPAAETYAREVIAQLAPADDIHKWPRRVASANIDLALTLLRGDRLDEACNAAQRAIMSGRIVPSNHWRALEVVKVVEARQLPEASDLREAYQGLKALGAGD
ncbi:helix-turn-helix domain-containing protein [Streptomyces yunnanensis]|uniref:Helix-turn-helix domain-containing protein n=1 Tax=Streptomyces yunnanensis TaxID=156453 RepID=A0ABY8ACH0_9ACTN|nr:helix-turn-helix domain-containing protein [Streptomyces yunnanensis]WEB42685.1 helix-turn-helix domain-containing protein [Streptomyces yunnanensis]